MNTQLPFIHNFRIHQATKHNVREEDVGVQLTIAANLYRIDWRIPNRKPQAGIEDATWDGFIQQLKDVGEY